MGSSFLMGISFELWLSKIKVCHLLKFEVSSKSSICKQEKKMSKSSNSSNKAVPSSYSPSFSTTFQDLKWYRRRRSISLQNLREIDHTDIRSSSSYSSLEECKESICTVNGKEDRGKRCAVADGCWLQTDRFANECEEVSLLLINRTPYQVQQHITSEQGKKTKTCGQKGGKTE